MTTPTPPAPGLLFSHLPDTDEVYVLGDTAAPRLVLNAYDDLGDLWFCDEPDGWDATEAVTAIDRRQDGDGGYAVTTYLTERTLTFDGMVVSSSPAGAKRARRRLLAALQGGRGTPILYTHPNDEPSKSLWVRPAGRPRVRIVGDACVFGFILVADDPVKFGPSTTYGPAGLPQLAGQPGRVYPRTYPVTYGVGQVGPREVVQVYNDGDEYGDAIYEVRGPVPRPVVYLSSGEFVGLDDNLGTSDDVMVVDTRAGTLRVNGVLRTGSLVAGSTYPRIPPGGAEVRLRSLAGGTSPIATLFVTTAPRYL